MAEPQKTVSVRYGGFWRRLAAEIIDEIVMVSMLLLIVFTVGLISGVLLPGVLPDAAAGILTLLALVAVFLYQPFFIATRGATFGKQALGLIVVDEDSSYPIGWKKALLREIVGKIILNRLTIYIGYLLIVFDARKQGLHDKIAGTFVVYKDSLPPPPQTVQAPEVKVPPSIPSAPPVGKPKKKPPAK
ncbi:MAG: RDD family protein [Candidatus Micrarchaeia archaeon]